MTAEGDGESKPYVDPATARESWAEMSARDPEGTERLYAMVMAMVEARSAEKSREETFWDARPELTTIRQFALSRLASPWAVLGGVLARVVAATPHNVCLPATVGGRGSLNLFVAFVGPSGGGKGIANAVAREVVVIPSPADESQVGTGEGLVHAFMRTVKDTATKRVVPEQYRTNVLLDVPEVDAIRAQAGRTGSTLLPFLRSAWSGEAVGRSTADVSRNLTIPAHNYRLAMTVGVQPGRADALLADSDGGTPQRFVWVPVIDASIEDGIDEPDPVIWCPPRWRGPSADEDALLASMLATNEMGVCDEARAAIRADRLARARGEASEALDGHAMLARLKVAAALAVLDGSTDVRAEDWSLAEVVMQISDRTRDTVQGHLENGRREAAGKRGVYEAEVAKVRDDITESRERHGVADRLVVLLGDHDEADDDGWQSESQLGKAFSGRRRQLVSDVLTGMEKSGRVESKRGRKEGSRVWRLKAE